MTITPLTHHPLPKLYLPYGTLHHLPAVLGGPAGRLQRQQITVHWFVQHRCEPLAPYALLLQQYHSLPVEEQRAAESMLDEFFTEDEFRQLRAYLSKHFGNADLRTSILVPPVCALKPDAATNAGKDRPYGYPGGAAPLDETIIRSCDSCASATESTEGNGVRTSRRRNNRVTQGFLPLTEAAGYDLPFAVCGYYTLPLFTPRSLTGEGRATVLPRPPFLFGGSGV